MKKYFYDKNDVDFVCANLDFELEISLGYKYEGECGVR
jgi:hypothetical protein